MRRKSNLWKTWWQKYTRRLSLEWLICLGCMIWYGWASRGKNHLDFFIIIITVITFQIWVDFFPMKSYSICNAQQNIEPKSPCSLWITMKSPKSTMQTFPKWISQQYYCTINTTNSLVMQYTGKHLAETSAELKISSHNTKISDYNNRSVHFSVTIFIPKQKQIC